MDYTVIGDWQKDLKDFLLKQNHIDCKRYDSKNIRDTLVKHCEYILGHINPKPRNVIIGNALKENSLYHKFSNEIINIISLFKDGSNEINEYLSKKAGDRDCVLRDVGIHHLHFKPKNDGRTDELLCVYIGSTSAYFLDISTHNKLFLSRKCESDSKKVSTSMSVDEFKEIHETECDTVWSEWMRILGIMQLFPEIAKHCVFHGLEVEDSKYSPGYEQILIQRKGLQTIYSVNNSAMFSPRFGSASSGHPLAVIKLQSHILESLCAIHNRYYHQNIDIKFMFCDYWFNKILLFNQQNGLIIGGFTINFPFL